MSRKLGFTVSFELVFAEVRNLTSGATTVFGFFMCMLQKYWQNKQFFYNNNITITIYGNINFFTIYISSQQNRKPMMSDVTTFLSSNKTFYNKNWWFCTSHHCVRLDDTGEWERNCN
jgi:hypothetical protein